MRLASLAILLLLAQAGAGFHKHQDNNDAIGAYQSLLTGDFHPGRALKLLNIGGGGDGGAGSGSGSSGGSSTSSGGGGPPPPAPPPAPTQTVLPPQIVSQPSQTQNPGVTTQPDPTVEQQPIETVVSGGSPVSADTIDLSEEQQSSAAQDPPPGASLPGANAAGGSQSGGQQEVAGGGTGGGGGARGTSSGATVAQTGASANDAQIPAGIAQSSGQAPPPVPSSAPPPGGTEIRHPYIVSLRKDGQGHYCTGVLVSSQVVATAAQCVDTGASSSAVDRPTLYIGGLPREQPVEVRQTAGVTPHPSWQRDKNLGYDVALIRMDSPVGLKPINYPRQGAGLGGNEQLKIVSWGRTADGGPFADVLQQIIVPYVNPEICAASSPVGSNSIFLCAGGQGSNICNGDEGAPLFRDGGSASGDLLLGIASFRNVPCGDIGIPGIFTRVDQIGQWISENA